MPDHSHDHVQEYPHAAERLETIETLADALEDVLFDAIKDYADDHLLVSNGQVYHAALSLAEGCEERIIGYIARPTGEDPLLSSHLAMLKALDEDQMGRFGLGAKALLDTLHAAAVQFLDDHEDACFCVLHQGTRGLVHRVGLHLNGLYTEAP
jgi:hypothetical protein